LGSESAKALLPAAQAWLALAERAGTPTGTQSRLTVAERSGPGATQTRLALTFGQPGTATAAWHPAFTLVEQRAAAAAGRAAATAQRPCAEQAGTTEHGGRRTGSTWCRGRRHS
jgi:hypothetical protein